MAPQIIVALAAAGTLLYVVSAVRAWYRLRQFPGPRLASFSNLWNAKVCTTGRAVQVLAETVEKYGPGLVRIAPDVLLTNDPDVVRRVSGARSGYRRSPWYSSFRLSLDPGSHSMFSTPDPAYHDVIKHKTAAGFSGRDVPGMEADVDEVLGRLQQLIRSKYLPSSKGGQGAGRLGESRPMNLALVAQYYTLDTLGRIAYAMDFGHLETDSDVYSMVKTGPMIAPVIQMCSEVPLLRSIVFSDFVYKYIGPKTTDKEGMGRLQALSQEVVARRFGKDPEQKQDMLGSFIFHGLNRIECENEMQLQIVAGSDTSATVIRNTMLYLMTNVVVYNKLQREIDEGIREGRISTPITFEEAKRLPYLQAVIMESMRMHPGISANFLKTVPPEGDVLCGQKVPGGTYIAMNLWSLLRRKDLFGDDADTFRPERWLDDYSGTTATAEGEARRAEMAKAVDLNFGYGRYQCAGKMIALKELNKIFVELLRYFDFQLVDPTHPVDEVNFSLFYIHNLWVRVTERELV